MTSPEPRPRPSKAVYRRRRLMVLLIVLVVIAVVWLLIARPWSGSATAASTAVTSPTTTAAHMPTPTSTGTPSPTMTPSPTTSSSPSPSTSGSPSPSPSPSSTVVASACDVSQVTVVPQTDHTVYSASQHPKLTIKLTNTSAEPCKINVGTSTQSFVITSGTDTWWRSTDCQKDPSDMVVLLKAGQTVTSSTPVVWDRTRSTVNSCSSKSRPVAPGGGATYHLTVSIGGFNSLTDTMFQLG